MGSAGNQNPWAPYDSYKDCSVGICSVYCPQWCFYILPPPPPDEDDDSGPTFSPLIIAIIGILASAFLLVTYYTLITKYCRRADSNPALDLEAPPDQWHPAPAASGLDESVIKSIAVCKYTKNQGFDSGTECSVCLCEFQDEENLRLLPKCNHAFHLPCIDTWLKSHSNCPLCRAIVASPNPNPPLPDNNSPSNPSPPPITVDAPTELVLVVEDRREENSEICNDNNDENGDEEGLKQLRRSISLGTFFSQQRLSVSNVLRIDEELQGDGSSRKCDDGRSYGAIGRSVSTGRFNVLKV